MTVEEQIKDIERLCESIASSLLRQAEDERRFLEELSEIMAKAKGVKNEDNTSELH